MLTKILRIVSRSKWAEKTRMEACRVVSKENAKRSARERFLTWLALALVPLLLAWLLGWI